MIIYRPHKEWLSESMEEAKEFNTMDDMLTYIVNEHNKQFDWFRISKEEINISPYGTNGDERVGWHNLFIVCFERFTKIKNKESYLIYFGIKNKEAIERIKKRDIVCGVLGMCSDNYEKDI